MLPSVTRYSVLVWQERQKKCFGAAEWQEKCFGMQSVMGMPSQDQYGGRL